MKGFFSTYYRDGDGDTFGDLNNSTDACSQPDGYVVDSTDCDDSEASINPVAVEVCEDGVDNNCDGNIDEGCSTCVDADGDGYDNISCGGNDCDDSNSGIYPGATETCDGKDNDCDNYVDEDLTRATSCGVGACSGNIGIETCTAGSWGGDTCDPLVGAVAETCDGIDNDCDGQVDEGLFLTYYRDGDGDSFGDLNNSTDACSQPDGYVVDSTDCDDSEASINPVAVEVCEDGVDNNCDGNIDEGCSSCLPIGSTCSSRFRMLYW